MAHPSSPRLSLDELIALTEEIAALARAGVPLDRGLIQLARDLPGRLRNIAADVGHRLESGEQLQRVIEQMRGTFPPYYVAVIESGVRSGRLTAALQGLATTSRRVADLRRETMAALVYPLLLLLLVYALLIAALVEFIPRVRDAYEAFGASYYLLDPLEQIGQSAAWWAPWPPLVALLLLAWWWYRVGQGKSVGWLASPWSSAARWPTIGGVISAHRAATFAEVLTLLVEHDVPLAEALVLAADSTGDRRVSRAARDLAARVEQGDLLDHKEASPQSWSPSKHLPPLLEWLVLTSRLQPKLEVPLRRLAQMYGRRAHSTAQRAAVALPFWMAVALAGVAVTAYALIIFAPFARLLWELGDL